MDPLIIYLIVINLVAFTLFTIDFWTWMNSDSNFMDSRILALFALAGGGVGMLVALFIWTRKLSKHRITKQNVAWWFEAILCIFLWALFLAWQRELVYLDFDMLFQQFDTTKLKMLGAYLVIINVVNFILFVYDKIVAPRHQVRLRIPEYVLLFMSLMGGSLGGILAMYLMNHKVSKWYFTWGLPFFILVDIGILAYAHSAGLI